MGILFCCMRPCGLSEAVIRVVHFNGYVEEMSRPVKAREVMEAHPHHLIGQPSYLGIVQPSSLLPPDADLQAGHIYFLLPTTTPTKSSPPRQLPAPEPPTSLRRTRSLASSASNAHRVRPLDPFGGLARADQKPPLASGALTRASSDSVRPGRPRPVLVAAPPAPFLFKRDDKVAQLIISRQCLAEILRTHSPSSSVTIEEREDDWRLTKRKKKKKKLKKKMMDEERESLGLLSLPPLKPSLKLQKDKEKEKEKEKEEKEGEETEPPPSLSHRSSSSSSKSVTWRPDLESIHEISSSTS